MSRYRGSGERWPYHGIKQEDAGDRKWSVEVEANDISHALEKIELFRDGIESGPHVWMAPIQKVELIG